MPNIKPILLCDLKAGLDVLLAVPCPCRLWSPEGLSLTTLPGSEEVRFLHCRIVYASVPYVRIHAPLYNEMVGIGYPYPAIGHAVCDTRTATFWSPNDEN